MCSSDLVVACAAHSAYQFWWAQQVPSNLIIGFVNGSGYAGFSDNLFWTPAFVYFRILVTVIGVGYLALAVLMKSDGRKQWRRPAAIAGITIVVVVVGVSLFSPDKWGIGNGRTRISSRLSKTYETEHVILHYAADTPVAGHIARIAEDHEWYFHQLSGILNHTPT